MRVLLIILVMAILFYGSLSWFEKKSRRELLLKATETNKVEICLSGTQSQRARNCPDIIRQLTPLIHQLQQDCKDSYDKPREVMFDGKQYSCSSETELVLLKERLIRAIRH